MYDNLGYTNPQHHWLTYETLFNHPTYRRSNQQQQMGTYLIPLDRVRVILAADVPPEVLDRLCAAFTPDLTPDWLVEVAPRPWAPGHRPNKVRESVARANTYVVAPYNMRDNDFESPAIGTAPRTRHRQVSPGDRIIQRLTATWPMWSTASRSCVVGVTRVKAPGAPWPADDDTFMDDDRLEKFPWQMKLGGLEDPPPPPGGGTALRNDQVVGCFSLKSGVMYVGESRQGGAGAGGKATLEENSIQACLRGDHIAHADRLVGHDPVTDPEIVILPEVLTVTEDRGDVPGDGFQVRDLSRLRPDRVYLPALSIPYLGSTQHAAAPVAFDTLAQRWAGRASDPWAAFWAEHYAALVGRAKATLLVRYGLQLGTPNSQNFLLEFTPQMQPTGRLVLRDVGDAMLHTEAVWALFGPGGAPPASLARVQQLSSPAVAYECTTLVDHGDYYPGQTGGDHGNSFDYPAGTQFHWHFYSSLGKGGSVGTQSSNSTDPAARAAGWQDVLWRNAVWGNAHNRAYVAHLESVLGLAPINPAWETVPSPERYRRLANDGYTEADQFWRADVAAERALAGTVHAVLAGEAGQTALRAHRDRRWRPASFTITVAGAAPQRAPVAGSRISYTRLLAGEEVAKNQVVQTDAHGRVELPGHPGQYRLRFADLANTPLSGSLVDLRPGQVVEVDAVRITIAART